MANVTVTTTMSYEFHELAKRHNIKISEALRQGVSLMLAEIGEGDYDNRLNIMRRMEKMANLLQVSIAEAEELKAKTATLDP